VSINTITTTREIAPDTDTEIAPDTDTELIYNRLLIINLSVLTDTAVVVVAILTTLIVKLIILIARWYVAANRPKQSPGASLSLCRSFYVTSSLRCRSPANVCQHPSVDDSNTRPRPRLGCEALRLS